MLVQDFCLLCARPLLAITVWLQEMLTDVLSSCFQEFGASSQRIKILRYDYKVKGGNFAV